ncbi:hypothetical protein [Streptomyces sp. NPDC056527]|uniref:hypothetical protein n=1 Tax=Streptomyces sp. NPDC056527 TaxID=3345853 RepID=UPI0036ADD9C4
MSKTFAARLAAAVLTVLVSSAGLSAVAQDGPAAPTAVVASEAPATTTTMTTQDTLGWQ